MDGTGGDLGAHKTLPKQKRSIRTREKLIEHGRRAFTELGHDRVNLARDILEPAEVSVGSFYHQFSDKTELLLAVMERQTELRRRELMVRLWAMASQPGSTPRAALRSVLALYVASLETESHGWGVSLRERTNPDPRVQDQLVADRKDWLEGLAAVLALWFDATEGQIQRAAEMMTLVGNGLNHLISELDAETLDVRREEIVLHAADFIHGGLTDLLGESHPAASPA